MGVVEAGRAYQTVTSRSRVWLVLLYLNVPTVSYQASPVRCQSRDDVLRMQDKTGWVPVGCHLPTSGLGEHVTAMAGRQSVRRHSAGLFESRV